MQMAQLVRKGWPFYLVTNSEVRQLPFSRRNFNQCQLRFCAARFAVIWKQIWTGLWESSVSRTTTAVCQSEASQAPLWSSLTFDGVDLLP